MFVFIFMFYYWLCVIDGFGVFVRIVLLDFCKVFDLVDYNILVGKFYIFGVKLIVINWIIDFLKDRK